MDCNNTLVDTELGAIFPATNKEMRQIEQPMECPVERTQHKCKKCARFFSDEGALKQYHC